MKGCYLGRLGYTGCDGRLDPAHFVTQQRIKEVLRRRGIPRSRWGAIVWDTRTYTLICRQHHHMLDNKIIRLSEQQYPESFRQWAREQKFEWRGARDGWVGVYVTPGAPAA